MNVSHTFYKSMRAEVWRVNALLVVNDILVAIMVGIGAYGHRYRHSPSTSFIYDGATSLFLPIMSYIISVTSGHSITGVASAEHVLMAECFADAHMILILIWTGLVLTVAINTTTIVAGDDRESRNISPSVVLLVQAGWTSYLALYNIETLLAEVKSFDDPVHSKNMLRRVRLLLLHFIPFATIFAKMASKFYSFYKVRRSFSLGRNPRLIVGYMEQLQIGGRQHDERLPPPLFVLGEDPVQVDEQPHGYSFMWVSDSDQVGATARVNSNNLVTIDKVWQLDDTFLGSMPRFKDLCLSFALFKLLRCRFARYTFVEAGFQKVHNFFWHVLIKDSDDERVLGVITDELCFLYDYYYLSVPISYPNCWIPILNIFISLLSIGYCLSAMLWLIPMVVEHNLSMYYVNPRNSSSQQVLCAVIVDDKQEDIYIFGRLRFDLVPVYLLLALVVLTEAREIASYIFCKWTKVGVICRFVTHASWQQSPTIKKWVCRLLQCSCKLLKNWEDKMYQCSILVLHPRKTPLALLRRLIPLPDRKKNVKVPRAVKAAIIATLRSYEGSRGNGVITLRRNLRVGDNFTWTFNGKGTAADTILVWYIATSIFEVRHPHTPEDSDHKTVATHLSRYCAYLVISSPELLPDEDVWCKSLYKAVKKDADGVLAGGGINATSTRPEAEYRKLVDLLNANSKHQVLKEGAKLGEMLVESIHGEETAWKVLAGFWSEMILYVAPSDNLDGHAEAIARGGELVTLLWALLAHAGIIKRTPTVDATNAASTGSTSSARV